MTVTAIGLVLSPHCDLHVALTGPALRVVVDARSRDSAKPGRYGLANVTHECAFDFFAPHNEVGHRFEGLPQVDAATGLVTATVPGVYLFQVRRGEHQYIVGRLQVHKKIEAWWFGIDSITTALDVGTAASPGIAHVQPSIYAKFSDDASGADRIGDITGHGYVRLTAADPAVLAVTAQGRLRGLVETTDPLHPTHVTGSFLGHTATLPVRVFDYAKSRPDLYPVQTPNVAEAGDMHNIVFVPEGFQNTAEDREVFDQIVTRTVREMFDKPRHEPYAMLEGSFNVFKAFIPSQEHFLTCGFRVTDDDFTKAQPIPFNERLADEDRRMYTMQELVTRVGLPKHNESRLDPVADWRRQSLKDFVESKVDNELVIRWRAQDPVGILHARDTILGLYLGGRPADGSSGFTETVVKRPETDEPGDALRRFVARVYEFYAFTNTRTLTLDPRRHPPELYASILMDATSIVRYLSGLKYAYEPNLAVGRNWVPDNTKPTRSQGLVAVIAFDDVKGGTSDGVITAQTMARALTLPITYSDLVDKREMRRVERTLEPDFGIIVDTLTHEFGHSLNLGDEYEKHGGDDDAATWTTDVGNDNVTVLGFLRAEPAPSRMIDPAKVKWLHLPRMILSAALLIPSSDDLDGIKVTIDPRYIGKWVQAKKDGVEVRLRNFVMDSSGRQLPLSDDSGQLLTGLGIGDINESRGTLILTGPPLGLPTYARGSVVYVPLKAGTRHLEVVHENVQKFLFDKREPLNRDPDHDNISEEPDVPRDIPGFTPPCNSARTVGVFEGARSFAGGFYRPTGTCKMRDQRATLGVFADVVEEGAFCYVCKWLIVNRVDPSYHAILSGLYYPEVL
jgi:hypothetical protein